MHSVADVVVSDIPCDLFLIPLVDENEGVVLWISSVILDPIITRVSLLFVFTICDCDVRRGGYSLEECGWGSSLLDNIFEIWFDFVRECGHIGEVGDAVVLAVGDGERFVDLGVAHGCDRNHHVSCACFHKF